MFLLLLYICLWNNCFALENITINANETGDELKRFWRSTGFSPLGEQNEIYKYLLSDDELFNIALIGALPNGGIKQVRVHWLINLIRFENGTNNYANLDNFLDWIHKQRLKPGFEIMGNPMNVKREDMKDTYNYWYNLVKNIAARYIGRYGLRYVQKWRFETWNEPDLRGYNINNFTLEVYIFACRPGLDATLRVNKSVKGRGRSWTALQVYLSDAINSLGWASLELFDWTKYLVYISACRSGLDAALRANKSVTGSRGRLKLGGPAGLFKRRDDHPLCWGSLELCDRAISDVSSCPLQYISFHRKGEGTAENVLSGGLQVLDIINSTFPRLKHIPVANDEADILTNWRKDEEWRGDVRYPAMIVKVIIDYFKEVVLKRKLKIEVLSNDNGFLNYHPYYFTQRTLFARFQMNNTTPRHLQFVWKPVYAVMGLLSFLQGRYIKASYSSHPLINVLATKDDYHLALTVAYVNDTFASKTRKKVTISLQNLWKDCKYVIYQLDNENTNPFLLWKLSGSPVFPWKELRMQMRNAQQPYRLLGPSKCSKQLEVNIGLSLPSILLVNICSSSSLSPGKVTELQAINVTYNEVLIIWKDKAVNSKCIQTYEVEYEFSGEFMRINPDTMFLSYHHVAIVPSEKTPSLRDLKAKKHFQLSKRAMFYCYQLRKHPSDNIGSDNTSMVSLISTRTNYSSVLTMDTGNMAALFKRITGRRKCEEEGMQISAICVSIHYPMAIAIKNAALKEVTVNEEAILSPLSLPEVTWRHASTSPTMRPPARGLWGRAWGKILDCNCFKVRTDD